MSDLFNRDCGTMAFPFLELPGELRNRIYYFVATANNEVTRIKHLPTSGHVIQCDTTNVPYAPLTRVCSQIRKEYVGLHRHNARVSIRWCDIEKFMADFFDEESPVKELQIHFSGRPDHLTEYNKDVDLLPILRAKAQSPGHFTCRAILDDPEPMERGRAGPSGRRLVCLWNAPTILVWELDILLRHENAMWRATLCNPPYKFAAVTYNVICRKLAVVLNPRAIIIDLDNAIELHRFKHDMGLTDLSTRTLISPPTVSVSWEKTADRV